ncbi:Nramp family divalent metal transporter [Gimesia maris]|uniref:Divalent metal cation transporter MntH n=1 Tax=Gimesia maris TaxID=122 RepID=A0ABX5YWL6_9PLAN|nr:Nramp family divalent metal transporter [Gimesia maris]EDL61020.1 probable Cytochrome ba3-putative manganese transport protein mntH [Gimesia maris DSM 8797]QDU18014.1 Divalent metal cation transporter MntH [Gimesia maris]QEG20052.1 Divalent metal cation transporter MntH [Gimesia maris]QGQ32469.1 divalent metal cation transporter [Gimesia maris]|tara:strand:+ start:15896 stop:17167 length:1272 start_codon:yes stop_codon:yes gene_type:complete
MNDQPPTSFFKRLLASLGPAIITASVVLGPGSILSASKIGHTYAYQMSWVLVIAVIMMIAMTALSARLGIQLKGTICDELAERAGRPVAAATGVILFLIAACFQFSNNLGVLAAVEPFMKEGNDYSLAIIIGMNAFIILALYGFKHLYGVIEKLMKLLVAIMIIAFAINLFQVKPDWLKAIAGLIPSLPEQAANGAGMQEVMTPIVAMYATTFSVAGAFYQSYLVRQKGWTRANLKQGLIDSTLGISMLGLITLMVLITAAKVLYQNPDVETLTSVSDVATSLEPGFGKSAMVIFSLGIFAGAFSSFLVNAMIGGSILADGFGLGGYIDQKWPKLFTVFALMVGMAVAIYTKTMGQKPVGLIIFAQSLTVLGIPMLAIAMLWLATRADMKGENAIPAWMKILGFIGLITSVLLAIRTAVNLLS